MESKFEYYNMQYNISGYKKPKFCVKDENVVLNN